jgi:dihydroorotate dehydrogenase
MGGVFRFTDAESAHRLALRSLRMGLYVRDTTTYDTLHTTLCGMPLANPVGLAAGFDKDGEAIGELILGF